VLTAQAVFLLELGQTDRQTDRQTRLNVIPALVCDIAIFVLKGDVKL